MFLICFAIIQTGQHIHISFCTAGLGLVTTYRSWPMGVWGALMSPLRTVSFIDIFNYMYNKEMDWMISDSHMQTQAPVVNNTYYVLLTFFSPQITIYSHLFSFRLVKGVCDEAWSGGHTWCEEQTLFMYE